VRHRSSHPVEENIPTFVEDTNQFLTGTVPKPDCPVGTIDNSPAFQRRVGREQRTSPEGTAEEIPNSTVRDSALSLETPSKSARSGDRAYNIGHFSKEIF